MDGWHRIARLLQSVDERWVVEIVQVIGEVEIEVGSRAGRFFPPQLAEGLTSKNPEACPAAALAGLGQFRDLLGQ
jgi:hypothetical protein